MLVFGIIVIAMDGGRVLTKDGHLWYAFWLTVGLAVAISVRRPFSRSETRRRQPE